VILDPHPKSDQHQDLGPTTFRGSPFVHAYQLMIMHSDLLA